MSWPGEWRNRPPYINPCFDIPKLGLQTAIKALEWGRSSDWCMSQWISAPRGRYSFPTRKSTGLYRWSALYSDALHCLCCYRGVSRPDNECIIGLAIIRTCYNKRPSTPTVPVFSVVILAQYQVVFYCTWPSWGVCHPTASVYFMPSIMPAIQRCIIRST